MLVVWHKNTVRTDFALFFIELIQKCWLLVLSNLIQILHLGCISEDLSSGDSGWISLISFAVFKLLPLYGQNQQTINWWHFSQKIGFDISQKLSPKACFLRKTRKIIKHFILIVYTISCRVHAKMIQHGNFIVWSDHIKDYVSYEALQIQFITTVLHLGWSAIIPLCGMFSFSCLCWLFVQSLNYHFWDVKW